MTRDSMGGVSETVDMIALTIGASEIEPEIKNLIYTVRGQQVLLYSDIARLYGVETGALIRAARRNEERCPEVFRFQLMLDERENLK